MESTERLDTPGPVRASQDDALFARRLHDFRGIAGLTQQQLADRMNAAGYDNIHRSTIGKIESGDRPVSIGEAVAFARIIGVDLADLITEPVSPDSREYQEALAALGNWERQVAEHRVRADRAAFVMATENQQLQAAQAELGAAAEHLDKLRKGTGK